MYGFDFEWKFDPCLKKICESVNFLLLWCITVKSFSINMVLVWFCAFLSGLTRPKGTLRYRVELVKKELDEAHPNTLNSRDNMLPTRLGILQREVSYEIKPQHRKEGRCVNHSYTHLFFSVTMATSKVAQYVYVYNF